MIVALVALVAPWLHRGQRMISTGCRVLICSLLFVAMSTTAELKDVYGIYKMDIDRQYAALIKSGQALEKDEYANSVSAIDFTIEITEERFRVVTHGQEMTMIAGKLKAIDVGLFEFSGTSTDPLEERLDRKTVPMRATINFDKSGKAEIQMGSGAELGAVAYMVKSR